jgi:hypothetical protein
MVEEFSSREDGGRPILNGAASDRAELSYLQNRGQKREQWGNHHLDKELVVSVEESDWP